jgi:cellulose biosynthesis protein BcsQ
VEGESLCESEHRNRYTRTQYNEVKVDELMKNFKEDKFIQSYNKGYDSFYLIPGGKDLSVENEELEVKGNYTKGKLKSAFVKMGKKKQTNRVLVSKFIAGIA